MEKVFIEQAFQKCKERGWLSELIPSVITEEQIKDFEKRYDLTLPQMYKAFLTTYQISFEDICGIISYDYTELQPSWLMLNRVQSISELEENIKIFLEIAEIQNDEGEAAGELAQPCAKLIPIGDWGAGCGPLCLDLAKPEELVIPEDPDTWSLVWFDHDEFDWGTLYMGEDGLLHGQPAAPDLKTLLEWYFCGSLEAEFEEETGIHVTREWLMADN